MDTRPGEMLSAAEQARRKIKAMKDVVIANREAGDRLRRLPDPVAQAFLDADVYRLLIPRDFGGAGLEPKVVFELVEELSSYDGSVGWNLAVGCAGLVSFYKGLPFERFSELCATPDCGFAGSNAPGRAIAVDGGYLLSGKWSWASGIYQAKVIAAGAMVFDGDTPRVDENGIPERRFFVVPKDKITIHDAWYTSGMRGTGSTDWEADNVFIPDRDSCRLTDESEHSDPILHLPTTNLGFELSAVGLGVARSAIEGLKAVAAESQTGFRDQGHAQYAVAKAQALHESAYLYVLDAHSVIWNNIKRGTPHTLEDRARLRRAYVHATESARDAITLCSEAAGGAAAYEKWPFGRAVRDISACRAHIALCQRFMELAGQAAFGMQPQHPIF